MSFKFCPDCGTNIENQNEFKFCSSCGVSLTNATALNNNVNEIEDRNIYINVESEEKAKAKSGAMTILAYPLLIALLFFAPLIPYIHVSHEILRYKKFGWKKEAGFSWKKKIIFYVLYCLISTVIYGYFYINKNGVGYLFFGIAFLIYYIAFLDRKKDE